MSLPSLTYSLYTADLNTAFPAGINAAATFSRSLIRARGLALGEEFRGKGVDIMLGTVAGPLGRVPQGGRNWEGFSPDPYLTGVALAETVRGVQEAGVVACAKHYIMNEQEHYRNSISANVDDKTMHELYLWPFADAVRAGVGSVMCAYNRIHNVYSCESAWAQNYLLKNELAFRGFIVSDWGAQHQTVESALAGLDMAMPGDGGRGMYNSLWGGALTEAVLAGDVPQWRLDDMVTRIVASLYKVGRDPAERDEVNFSSWTKETEGWLYNNANRSRAIVNKHVDVQGDHGVFVRELAAKSTVLLKNVNKTLPLKPESIKSIAVIGEDAQDNPAGPNACPDRGCNVGTLAMAWGSATCEFPYLIAPATALKARAAEDKTAYTEVKGNYDLEAAKAAASSVDVAIVFANADAGENFITVGGNAGDRNNLTLWNGGDALIEAVASVNPNTIVVLHTVGPVLVEAYKQHPNITAILWAGLPGQESGNALVDVLYGRVNPQAKSPFTWGKKESDWGPDAKLMYQAPPGTGGFSPNSPAPQQEFPEGVFIDYRHFDRGEGIEPSYEFGFGLSYTTFAYSELAIEKFEVAGAPAATADVTVPAPILGTINFSDPVGAGYLMPQGFDPVPRYVYPWLSNSSRVLRSGNASVSPAPRPPSSLPQAAVDGSPQKILSAGGGPGGNPRLYDVLYSVTAVVENTGDVAGTEIPQLYLSLGGPTDPKIVLRGFDELFLQPKERRTVTFELTRRDISNWDTAKQEWVVSEYLKKVFVGASSRDLRLNGTLT